MPPYAERAYHYQIMAESMDIVKRLDLDPQFGPPVLAPAVDRKDLDGWVSSAGMLMRRLVRPRNAVTPLAEFQVITRVPSWDVCC